MEKYDFSGWATRNDIKCTDGRTIRKDAFKNNDGQKVPLVWMHQHNDPLNVLGHAMLVNKPEGVYTYCKFNDTEAGEAAKKLVKHGDVDRLSIYANQLKQDKRTGEVFHGNIREVSLVLAGANIGAVIDNVIMHGEDIDEAFIYSGEDITLSHSEETAIEEVVTEKEETLEHANENNKNNNGGETKTMAENVNAGSNKTVEEVWNTLTEEQKSVVYAMIGEALEEQNEGDDKEMKHNVFDNDYENNNVLSHADMEDILSDARRYGSLKDAVIQHGIEDIEYLFPEARNLNNPPEFIKRDMGWVSKFMNGVHHSPFSRIKSMFADITEEDARAKGYIKGKLKKDEVFSLLKRTTTPTTVYKKQKLDRDDAIDIIDFDVVAWLKSEMRMMLDEEIARAALVGDGRLSSSDDKINELNIRPIWKDEALYTIKAEIKVANGATADEKAKAFIRAAIKSRKNYKGSGEPSLYTTEDMLTDCLLLEDANGRVIYETVDKLKNALRVKDIVTVPVMEGLTRQNDEGATVSLMGIIVNLKDYSIGADKGGAVNMFDDFDIDYNAQKYLIETRCSGALIKPFSAIALELNEATAG